MQNKKNLLMGLLAVAVIATGGGLIYTATSSNLLANIFSSNKTTLVAQVQPNVACLELKRVIESGKATENQKKDYVARCQTPPPPTPDGCNITNAAGVFIPCSKPCDPKGAAAPIPCPEVSTSPVISNPIRTPSTISTPQQTQTPSTISTPQPTQTPSTNSISQPVRTPSTISTPQQTQTPSTISTPQPTQTPSTISTPQQTPTSSTNSTPQPTPSASTNSVPTPEPTTGTIPCGVSGVLVAPIPCVNPTPEHNSSPVPCDRPNDSGVTIPCKNPATQENSTPCGVSGATVATAPCHQPLNLCEQLKKQKDAGQAFTIAQNAIYEKTCLTVPVPQKPSTVSVKDECKEMRTNLAIALNNGKSETSEYADLKAKFEASCQISPVAFRQKVQTSCEKSSFADVDCKKTNGTAINEMFKRGVFSGYEDGNFKGGNFITKAEVAKVLIVACGKSTEGAGEYKDVNVNDWYSAWVKAATAQGITSGNPDGTFKPKENVNRATFSKMLVRACGISVSEKMNEFRDVSASDWFNDFASAAWKYKFFAESLKDNLFKPSKLVTREEVAVAVYNFLQARDAAKVSVK